MGSQRCDLAQRKIAAVRANGMEGYRQGRSHRWSTVGHRRELAVQMLAGGTRKVSEGVLAECELQWMLGQWQKGQQVKHEVLEQEQLAWVKWQQKIEEVRILEARQRCIVEVAEIAAELERDHVPTPAHNT